MPPTTTFLRLLAADDKPAALRAAIAATRAAAPTPDAYTVDPASFRQIPGSPFAYWVSERVSQMYSKLTPIESGRREVRGGLGTRDDFRFVRAWWEVSPSRIIQGIGTASTEQFRSQTYNGKQWVPFAKGGAYAPFYGDLALTIEWAHDGAAIKEWVVAADEGIKQSQITQRTTHWSRYVRSADFYFRPGVTYSDRTSSRFAARVLPGGAIISVKGSAAFGHNESDLWQMLALMESGPFVYLMDLTLGTSTIAKSYQADTIGNTPVPNLIADDAQALAMLAREAHNLKREADRDDEVTHPFTAPALARLRAAPTLREASIALALEASAREQRLADIQRMIDDRCFALYGFSEEDRAQVEGASGALAAPAGGDAGEGAVDSADDAEEEAEAAEGAAGAQASSARNAADLLMYAVGCAFGRWDVRIGCEPSLAPRLAEPFAPLPVCAPSALVGPDGLPASEQRIASEAWLRARPDAISLPPAGSVAGVAGAETITAENYPLEVAWDGILVDDPDAPDDIVRRIRATLEALWGDRADAIEAEACELLGVRDLRDELRNPRLFFDYHIKRYSKSRRKAPIYWLLQSPKRSYAIWLYYHRLDADLPFKALNFHLLPKIRLEEQRLEEQKAAKAAAAPGSADARRFVQAIDRQEALLADLREFRDALDRAARRYLKPDLNDGVLLNIAPYWEVVPWKEAKSAWSQLLTGKYEWSAIGKQLREKGLIAARRT